MRIKKWLSIQLEQNARGLLLVGIIIFNLLLWFVSSILAYIIAPQEYGSIINALWSSGITWMLEPGFYDPLLPRAIRIISIIVIITSMITFTGGIIGYVSNIFSSVIENAKRGKGKLYLSNHILILNWNNKALELIADYCYDLDTTTVAILSAFSKEEIETQINRKLYERRTIKKHLTIIIRQGDVFSKSDLDGVCIEKAKSIIILADNLKTSTSFKEDITVMKTLMLVSKLDLIPQQTIIVEVKDQQTIALINNQIANNTLLKEQILPLLPDELMGRLIAQTLLMPGLNKVYQEIFSFEGAEFYTLANQDVLDYSKHHNHAIPIFNRDKFLFVLSDSDKSLNSLREKPFEKYQEFIVNNLTRYQEKTVVIFGKNRKLEYILDSLKMFELENKVKINLTIIDSNEAKTIEEYTKNIVKIDHILILSKDNLDLSEYDADVLITLLLTQDIAKKHKAEFVVELLEPKHFEIAQSYNVQNTIISNEYVSRLITQLSKNRNLYYLFNELLTYDSGEVGTETNEVYIYKAEDIIQGVYPFNFESVSEFVYSMLINSKNEHIPIGLIKNHKMRIFKGDLDKQEDLIIESDDYIVLICK